MSIRMSWDSEEEHDAKERRIGALTERERIWKAQAGALRNLRVLLMPECVADDGGPGLRCARGRHSEDCPRGMMLEALRWLRAATREPRR